MQIPHGKLDNTPKTHHKKYKGEKNKISKSLEAYTHFIFLIKDKKTKALSTLDLSGGVSVLSAKQYIAFAISYIAQVLFLE